MTTPDGITKYDRELGTNLLKSVTDPLGRKTEYTYYANGNKRVVSGLEGKRVVSGLQTCTDNMAVL
jgi:uncharacterized protein RhaS with RHS repeats